MTIRSTLPKTLLLLLFAMPFTGCVNIIMKVYGIKSPKQLNEQQVLKFASKYNIPKEDCYLLDTAYYGYLFSLDSTVNKLSVKNHYQPLQALYYNKNGDLVSFHPNCYAQGGINLNWNWDSAFNDFVPQTHAPLDSIMPLDKHLQFLSPLTDSYPLNHQEYDYFIIVQWSRLMHRQSKRLINVIQENVLLHKGNHSVKIIYVNNDNSYSE